MTEKVEWERETRHRAEVHMHPAYLGGGRDVYKNAIRIEAAHHYNGSGDECFGGAKEWPVAEIQVPFPAGEEVIRDKLIEELKPFLIDFLKRNGLYPEE